MRENTLRVFISATTHDLGACRTTVKEELLTAGILPVTQENFSPHYLTLKHFIRSEISKCDAVVCLVGKIFGACEANATRNRRSYTQYEYDCAKEKGKPVFVFIATNDFVPDAPPNQSKDDEDLQNRYRDYLITSGIKWTPFSSVDDLKTKIAQAIRIIPQIGSTQNMYYLHFPKAPSYFVGRDMEICQLLEALKNSKPAIIAVIGMGGQGKTTLIHKVISSLDPLPFSAGFWCTAYRGGFTFDMFLDEALGFLIGEKFDKRNMPDILQRMSTLLNLLQRQKVLFVIDGIERWLLGWRTAVRDPQVVDSVNDRLAIDGCLDEFLQAASCLTNGTHIIVSSRALPAALDNVDHINIPVKKDAGEGVRLGGLDPTSAVELLGRFGIKGDPEQIAKLAASYANHPLALTIAGTLISKRYGGKLDRLPRLAPMDPSKELYKLFNEVRRNLPNRKKAELILKTISFCIVEAPFDAILPSLSWFCLKMKKNREALLDIIIMLSDWNLVSWDADRNVVRIHPLVKHYFRSLVSKRQGMHINRRMSKWYANKDIVAEARSLEEARTLVLAIAHAARGKQANTAMKLLFESFINGCSLFEWLSVWGHQVAGVEIIGDIVNDAKGELLGQVLLARAQFYGQLNKSELAGHDANKAIVIFEPLARKMNLAYSANLAKAYATVGLIHSDIGFSKTGEKYFTMSVNVLNRLEHCGLAFKSDLAKTLVNRSNSYRGMGSLSKALADCNRAYEIWSDLQLPSVKKNVLLSPLLTSRGSIFTELNKLNSAITDFEEAIKLGYEIAQEGKQDVERHIARSKSMFSIALRLNGRLSEALEYSTAAVDVLSQLIASGRNDFTSLFGLALVNRVKCYIDKGDLQSGLDDCRRALLIYERLVQETGIQFSIGFYHSVCLLSILEYETGDMVSWNRDRVRWATGMEQVLKELPLESELRIRFLLDGLEVVKRLASCDLNAGKSLLQSILLECEAGFATLEDSEALGMYLQRSFPLIEELTVKVGLGNMDRLYLNDIKSRVDKH